MPWRLVVALGRGRPAATAPNAFNSGDLHQPLHGVTASVLAGAHHAFPKFAPLVQTPVLGPQIEDFVGRVGIGQLGVGGPEVAGRVGVEGARGDLDAVLGERGTDRLDPVPVLVGPDVGDQDPSLRSSSAEAKNADAVLRISFARRSRAFS